MSKLDLRELLGGYKPRSLKFSDFMDLFVADPMGSLRTSSMLVDQAIRHFGFDIVVRSGEPSISYNLFKDPFSNGTTAVFGQEHCIKQIVDVVESIGKETSPQRGLVLVGPPASGKTNIVDLLSLALEEYSKQHDVRMYSFYFRFEGEDERIVKIHPAFRHNPIFLIPTRLQLNGRITHPRQELFEHVNRERPESQRSVFPTFYQNGYLDKRSLDILANVRANPRNRDKSLYDVLEEYVRVEEIDFSIPEGRGIANIDDMAQLRVNVQPINLGADHLAIVNEHLPGAHMYQYQGAPVAANRGLLHLHDAFGLGEGRGPREDEYKPLLMLLGSGKASVEATQTPIDTTVVTTTNIEEMQQLARQLTSSKLLDRIEEVPVNYLLDANSEMDILKRDMTIMRERYDVDPNLLRVASYFSVLTRLLPPQKLPPLSSWTDEKKAVYLSITPEQKLFIYCAQAGDPLATIAKLPSWHPFRNELTRLGIDINDVESYEHRVAHQSSRVTLEQSGVFSAEQLQQIDDDFMRVLWNEHYPDEGKTGISVRQLQNIMRDTIAHSDGLRIHVGTFCSRLKRAVVESGTSRRWSPMGDQYSNGREPCPERSIGDVALTQGQGDFGDYSGLVRVVEGIYRTIIRREITVSIVNRDPEEISSDLRKYLQHVMLLNANRNRAFAHIMVPRFTYFDTRTGAKIDEPDVTFLRSLEPILAPGLDGDEFRDDVAKRYLEFSNNGELGLEPGKSAVSSRSDNLLSCFAQEYSRLLSHRRTVGNVDPEKLKEALFNKRMSEAEFNRCDVQVKAFAAEIIDNMARRFSYSREGALDTLLFALRKNVVDFSDIIS